MTAWKGVRESTLYRAAYLVLSLTVLVLYAAGTGLAFAAPVASYVAYVVVAIMWFVPDRRLAPEAT